VSAGRADLAGEAAVLAGRFKALLREEPFDAVGDLSSLTVTTQVMLREDSYNDVLRLYREFMLCADITWDHFRLLHENHDVAEIYEIWVYLETVRAVAEILRQTGGARADLEDLLQINGQGLGVTLERGRASAVRFKISDGLVSVLYNATFVGAGSQPGARIDDRSYSLPLRPDVTIEIERDGQCTRLLLDAKYRVDAIGRIFEGEPADEADEAQAVATGTFKSADIYKMHTYRDAIGGARIAVAVYPGTEQQLYPRDDAMFRSEGGVGAVPLAPRAGLARDSFTGVLDRLITAATDG
jgi:predicted component of viral defense system (DUF524 family)